MITSGMMTSCTDEWATPQDLFNKLDEQYKFDLDPCSTDENAKCEKHFTKKDNGLSKTWGGCSVFMNPPYGRAIGKWVKKAYEEAQSPGTTVVCLLPARTDTAWFHDYCLHGEIQFIRGRVRFGNSKDNAPFPSMVVVFGEEAR